MLCHVLACIFQVLFAKDINSRQHTFEKALTVGEEYQKNAAFLILRSAVIKNRIHVPSANSQSSTAPGEFLSTL